MSNLPHAASGGTVKSALAKLDEDDNCGGKIQLGRVLMMTIISLVLRVCSVSCSLTPIPSVIMFGKRPPLSPFLASCRFIGCKLRCLLGCADDGTANLTNFGVRPPGVVLDSTSFVMERRVDFGSVCCSLDCPAAAPAVDAAFVFVEQF